MLLKKIIGVSAILVMSVGGGAAQAQEADLRNCFSVGVDEVVLTPGAAFIRTDSASCGNGQRVCISSDDANDIDAATANRLYAAALTAQATGSTLTLTVDNNQRACGNLPSVTNMRVQ